MPLIGTLEEINVNKAPKNQAVSQIPRTIQFNLCSISYSKIEVAYGVRTGWSSICTGTLVLRDWRGDRYALTFQVIRG